MKKNDKLLQKIISQFTEKKMMLIYGKLYIINFRENPDPGMIRNFSQKIYPVLCGFYEKFQKIYRNTYIVFLKRYAKNIFPKFYRK